MSIESVLVAGRRAAESRMTSTAVVRRPGGKTTDANGFEVDGWTEVYAALPCWVDSGGVRTVRVGDVEMQLAAPKMKVPHDTDLLRDGDLAAVVGGPCDGRFFRFVETTPLDQKKQQVFTVVETDRPGGWS